MHYQQALVISIISILTALNPNIIVKGQSICSFATAQNISAVTKGSAPVFINNFSANKCLRIGNFGHYASKLFLDECFWGKTKVITKDEKLYFKKTSLASNGIIIFNDAGLSQQYCLSLASDGYLTTANCRSSSWDQIWRIKTVRGHANWFQIQQASSSLCIVPISTTKRRSKITLNSCNAYQTEQLWKICATK